MKCEVELFIIPPRTAEINCSERKRNKQQREVKGNHLHVRLGGRSMGSGASGGVKADEDMVEDSGGHPAGVGKGEEKSGGGLRERLSSTI